MLGLVRNVFIDTGVRAQIAQMPVKRGLIFLRRFRDSRHHDVAAIAGVARRQEAPRFLAVSCALAVRGARQAKAIAIANSTLRILDHSHPMPHQRVPLECHSAAQYQGKITPLAFDFLLQIDDLWRRRLAGDFSGIAARHKTAGGTPAPPKAKLPQISSIQWKGNYFLCAGSESGASFVSGDFRMR